MCQSMCGSKQGVSWFWASLVLSSASIAGIALAVREPFESHLFHVLIFHPFNTSEPERVVFSAGEQHGWLLANARTPRWEMSRVLELERKGNMMLITSSSILVLFWLARPTDTNIPLLQLILGAIGLCSMISYAIERHKRTSEHQLKRQEHSAAWLLRYLWHRFGEHYGDANHAKSGGK